MKYAEIANRNRSKAFNFRARLYRREMTNN